MSQQLCLKWNNYMNNIIDVFKRLLSTEEMVDVTLACDGLSLKAHKIVLSACSQFFQSLFLEKHCKHPFVILKDMKYTELKAIIEFMYHGEVSVAQDQLSALMKAAETLRVKGLAVVKNENRTYKVSSICATMPQEFCLIWNNHMENIMEVFKNLLSTETMVDVTLACDGLSLKAHKIVLSACSEFFQSLFLENPCKHPIVILKDMKYTELKAIIEFMYHGEVSVAQDQLSALMKTAETLRVKGLAEVTNEKILYDDESSLRKNTRLFKQRCGTQSGQSDDGASELKIKHRDFDKTAKSFKGLAEVKNENQTYNSSNICATMPEQFCLNWNNHMKNVMDVFKDLLSTEAMADVTLACDGLSLKAHKIVLSACSQFFKSLFLENPCKHPIVILKDMKYTELKAIIEFMYHGEVNIAKDQLSALMKTADTLRVKGLAEVTTKNLYGDEYSLRKSPPLIRQRRGTQKRSMSDQSDDGASEPKIKHRDFYIEKSFGDMDPSIYSADSTVTNSIHKSQQKKKDPIAQGADKSVASEETFGVKPLNLLEQALRKEDLQSRSVVSSSNNLSMELQRRPRSSTHTSSSSISSKSTDISDFNQQTESPNETRNKVIILQAKNAQMVDPVTRKWWPGSSLGGFLKKPRTDIHFDENNTGSRVLKCKFCNFLTHSTSTINQHVLKNHTL